VTSLVVFVEVVATSIWLGGLVAIAIVSRIARRQLDVSMQIAFFRSLGRRYLAVGGGSLALALASGGLLLARGEWTTAKVTAVALGAALAIATLLAIRQARATARMRQRAAPADAEPVRAAAARAALLRGCVGALTVALVGVGSAIAA
jgi:uncharacterized membrane protein